MSRLYLKAFLSLAVVLGVTGCGARDFSDLDAYVAKVKASPPGTIEPLPHYEPYQAFAYRASSMRHPFVKPSQVQLARESQPQGSEVKPDLDRPREYLEGFPLDDLRMMGTIAREEGETLWALIGAPDGGIHRVKESGYLGDNHGKIIAISAESVNLIEIVPDGHGGWLERPRAISLPEAR